MMSLTACGTQASDSPSFVATPDLYNYDDSVQERAAEEVDQLAPPCPRDQVFADCSALHRMIIDYGTVRDQIRAAEK